MGDWRGESGGGDGGVISDVDAWECVGVRKGVREGRWGTRYTKQYSCAEVGREKVYGRRGLAHSFSIDRKGGVPRNAEVCSAGLI
jgi:hypothetical protein